MALVIGREIGDLGPAWFDPLRCSWASRCGPRQGWRTLTHRLLRTSWPVRPSPQALRASSRAAAPVNAPRRSVRSSTIRRVRRPGRSNTIACDASRDRPSRRPRNLHRQPPWRRLRSPPPPRPRPRCKGDVRSILASACWARCWASSGCGAVVVADRSPAV